MLHDTGLLALLLVAPSGGESSLAEASLRYGTARHEEPQDAAADGLKGSFPGSIRIPGTQLSLAFGGSIKLDAIHDFDAIGDPDAFKTAAIPVPEVASDGNTQFHARDTRLHLDARSPSSLGEIRGYVEGNFFGDGNSFELRHAYLATPKLLAGQTWTNFMLIDSRPETLDFDGPDGSVFLRQAQVRWTDKAGDSTHWTVALEDPSSDVTAPAGATAEQVFPDLTAGLRFDGGRGHTYLSAILREVSYAGAASDSTLGWGASLSGRLGTFGKDDLRFQIAYGEGIARYIEDLRGAGLDAGPDSGGGLEALPTYGGFLGYRHFWNDTLRSNLVYSMTGVDNSVGQAPDTLSATSYGAVNLIWSAAEALDVGVEFLSGRRENNDGQDATANRIQFSFIYTI